MRDTLGNTLRNLTLRAVVQAHKPEFIYYAQTYHQEITASDDFKSIEGTSGAVVAGASLVKLSK